MRPFDPRLRPGGTIRVALARCALVALVAAPLLLSRPPSRTGPAPRLPGAFRALEHWSASRAYPGLELPADAHARGHAHARAMLRRPLADAFDVGDRRAARAAEVAGWQAMGPTNGGGRALVVAIDPHDPDVLYAGSASGGLWRTSTGGVGPAAWTRIETGFPVLGVTSIAFAPGAPGTMYVGTGEVYQHQRAGDLAADRATRGSYGIGILKSVDGGATWTKSLDWSANQRHGVWAVRVHPVNPDIVWAATTDGVYRSSNAGATWTQRLAVVMAMDLVVHPVQPETVLVACGNRSSAGRGLYRTTNGGQTWSAITGGGLPSTFAGKIQLGTSPADPDLVYASIGNGFEVFGPDNATWLVRSTDFGATWTLRSTVDYSKWQGWYAHDVSVHPVHPESLVCVGIDAWVSGDGGATLVQTSDYRTYATGELAPGGPEGGPIYSHADHHDVIHDPTNPRRLYLANDGGVFRSLDGGRTFEGINGGLQTQQFYNGTVSHPTDPDLAMGGLQDFASAIWRGDGRWVRWVLGGDGGWCAINPQTPSTLYATAQWLFVGRSTNGGASFTDISPYPSLGGPVAFIAPLVMSAQNPQVLYAATSYLFKTFNGGGLWYVGKGGVPLDGNAVLLLAVSPHSDAVLYAATMPGTGRGRIHRTTNGGSSFLDVTGTLPDRYPGDLLVDPVQPGTVYVTMSGFGTRHVFRSTNHGATWTDIDRGLLPDVPTTAIAVDPLYPTHVYVGNDLGVFFTANLGESWVQLDQGLPEAVLVADLGISPADRTLRVFTHGNGAWQRDLLGAAVEAGPPSPGPRITLAGAPNPFRESTRIAFDLPGAGAVVLDVFDLRGARVRRLVEGARAAGPHAVAWDGRDDAGRRLPPGAYVCRLRTPAGEASRTLQLVR